MKAAEPAPLEEKSAVPEADTITAAAAMDPPAGSETGKPMTTNHHSFAAAIMPNNMDAPVIMFSITDAVACHQHKSMYDLLLLTPKQPIQQYVKIHDIGNSHSAAAVTAEDLAPAPAAASEEEVKPDVSNTSEMPVEEAVKVIGGTQAGSAPVSEAPTANKALDAVPVGPDPAAAAPAAADDTPQDGEYFLDATLADSMQVCTSPRHKSTDTLAYLCNTLSKQRAA